LNDKMVKFFISLLVALWIGISAQAFNNAQTPDPLCGPNSLLKICEEMKIKSTIKEICELTGYDRYTGTTMLGLYMASQKLGLPVVPLRIDIDQLASINSPAIAFIDGNHFVVVHGIKGNNLLIQDPPSPLFMQSKELFKTHWNGEMLVFSEKLRRELTPQLATLSLPDGPKIKFNETNHNFETIDEGDKLTYTFSFTNIGSETLEVQARSTCTCTAAVVSENRILPGGKGKIKLEFNTHGRKGLTKQSVFVKTNDPANKYVTLAITATVEPCVKVIPEKIWLDNIVVGQKIEREIYVVPGGNENLIIKSIETPEGIKATILNKNDNNTIPILLTIVGETTPGNFEKKIVIHTNNSRRSDIIVPISGYRLSEIKAIPPAFYFGEISSGTPTAREIIITTTQKHNLNGIKVKSASHYVSFDVKQIENNEKYKVTAILNLPENTSMIKENIIINDGNNRVLEVPLFALVRKKN
jgi:predicted double-glycine peptidase